MSKTKRSKTTPAPKTRLTPDMVVAVLQSVMAGLEQHTYFGRVDVDYGDIEGMIEAGGYTVLASETAAQAVISGTDPWAVVALCEGIARHALSGAEVTALERAETIRRLAMVAPLRSGELSAHELGPIGAEDHPIGRELRRDHGWRTHLSVFVLAAAWELSTGAPAEAVVRNLARVVSSTVHIFMGGNQGASRFVDSLQRLAAASGVKRRAA